MKMTIGVMGSVSNNTQEASELAYKLGCAIANNDCITVTGACPGLPYDSVMGAKDNGGMTVGVSPGHNFAEHTIRYNSPHYGFDILVYTGSGLMGREITGVRTCDMVAIVGGRSGTLGEFAIAYDEGKIIGVLKGTGGISDAIEALIPVINKDTGAVVLYNDDPEKLVVEMVELSIARRLSRANRSHTDAQAVKEDVQFNDMSSVEEAINSIENEIALLQESITAHKEELKNYKNLKEFGHTDG